MADLFPSVSVLIPELKSGNQIAWNELCDKFQAGLVGKSRWLLRSSGLKQTHNSDDLVQEAFLKAWQARESFNGNTTLALAKWMLVILENSFLDRCRRSKKEVRMPTWFDFADHGKTPSAAIMTIENEASLHACLMAMRPDYQRVLILRHFDGLKFAEIAQSLNMNINTVAGIYRRGLTELSDKMKQVSASS